MSRRVHIAVFGSGLGHVARMVPVAEALRNEGVSVGFSSFFYAVDYLKSRGFPCDRVAPVDIEWRDGGVSTINTARRLPTLVANFAMQVNQERRIIRRFRPDLVLSDTRLSAVVAAAFERAPSITVANQLRILLPPQYHATSLSKTEGISAETLGLLWSRSQLILVPDLPPPHTISEKNTSGIRTLADRIRYVGFMTPVTYPDPEQVRRVAGMLNLDGSKPVVFANISGPPETKEEMVEAVLKAADLLRDRFVFVVSRGEVGGSEEPKRIRGGWLFGWCPVKDELVSISDLLIVRGGHSTLAQATKYSKPVVVVPIKNHSEQHANASRVSELGLGRMINSPILSGRSLAGAVEEVSGDPAFRSKAQEMGGIARRMDGVEKTADIVRSLL